MHHFIRPVRPGDHAVIFTSQRTPEGGDSYGAMGARMLELARSQSGYVGVETVRGGDGFGITVSYWESEESIRHWKANAEHQEAQRRGREEWYADFALRICRVERAYGGGSRQ